MTSDPTELSPLGAAMEKGRIATGLSTEAFLRTRGLTFRTWRRLLHGELAPAGWPPREATIVRYGRAAGLSADAALALARRTYSFPHASGLTRLGAALEERRLEAGVDTRPFLAKHSLSVSTWYRLLYGAGTAPTPDTLGRYARAAGLEPEVATALFEQDCRSGRFAGKPGYPVAPNVAADAPGGGSAGDSAAPADL